MLKNRIRCVRGKRKTVKICWCTQWFVSAAVKTISHKCFNVTDFPFTKILYWTHSHATILIFIYIVVVTAVAVAAATAVFVVVALPFCLKQFLSSAQWLWFSCEPHELIRSTVLRLLFISSALTFFRVTIFSVFLLGQWFGFSFSFAHISYKCSTFFHRCQTLLFRKNYS